MHKVVVNIDRPDPAIVARFRPLAFALIAEQVGRSQMMDPAIRAFMNRDWVICGPAVTVKLEAVDILMGMAAAEVARPGDVIVVAAQGHTEAAVWGGSMTRSAQVQGCEAVVIDGMVQDTRSLLAREVPIFCRGTHLTHGTMNQPGSVNVPISCGGVVVNPGDLIMANLDGVMVLPKDDLEAILGPAEETTRRLRESHADPANANRTFFAQRNGRERLDALGVAWVE